MTSARQSTIFKIAATWDAEAGPWTGSCDAIQAAAEARTLDDLLARIERMTADVLPDNFPELDPASVFLQVTALREIERRPATAD